jgi:citrate lyase synthetase
MIFISFPCYFLKDDGEYMHSLTVILHVPCFHFQQNSTIVHTVYGKVSVIKVL